MPITTPLLSYLQNSEKVLPMLMIEGPTTLGRTYQGYKRGGRDEAREKICEETLGGVVWLFGVKALNSAFDFVGDKVLGLKELSTDVGKDSLRNPFANVLDKKGITALYKFSKIALSAILGTLAMGIVVPRIKLAMTNAFRMQAGYPPEPNKNSKDGKFHPDFADKLVSLFIKYDKNMIYADEGKENQENQGLYLMPTMSNFLNNAKNSDTPLSFKGGFTDAVLYASHNLENNNAWRLMSTDVGTLTGRVANSRNKKEGIEYFVRDSISSVFYIFAAPIFSSALRKVLNVPDVHPKASEEIAKRLKEAISSGEIASDDLSSKILSKDMGTSLVENIKFKENKTITLDEFNIQTGGVFDKKASLMSKMQPKLQNEQGIFESILSEKQVVDIMSDSPVAEPKFLKKAIAAATDGKSDDVRAFVSRNKLEKIRDSFDDFVFGLEKYVKKKAGDGCATDGLIDKYAKNLNRKNLLIHLAGMAFAVLGLAVFIPKFQYFVSEKLTGDEKFPGTIEKDAPKSDK